MKLKRVLLVVSCLMLGVGSFTANATSAEPTLKSILKAEANSLWTQISFADLASASWNTAGATLTFSLIAEHADFAGINSFRIKDDNLRTTIFAGSATPASPSVTYVLKDELSSVYFRTGTENSSNYKIFFNSTAKEYAFAYEDVKGKASDNDYNDMVVTMRAVVPVPEPESVAMLMAGLGLMGMIARRKKKIAA
jgi:hypothetical protein